MGDFCSFGIQMQNHQKITYSIHWKITVHRTHDNNDEARSFYGLWSINFTKQKFMDLIDRYRTITMEKHMASNLLTLTICLRLANIKPH